MKHKLLNKLWLRVGMIVAIMTTALAGTIKADPVTLVSGSGTSGYAIPDGWTKSGTVDGGQYLKFDNGTITSPEFAPHTGLSFTYSVATFGSGTNHPLTIRILNASTNAVIVEETTSTPTSNNYITTGSPLSLGDVNVAFKIQIYAPTGKGIRLRNYSVTGTPAGGGSFGFSPSSLTVTYGDESISWPTLSNPDEVEVSYSSSNTSVATVNSSTGVVSIVKPGETTITATDGGTNTSSYGLTVNKAAADLSFPNAEVFTKPSTAVDALVLTNPHSLSVTYSTSDADVVDVNASTGVLTVGAKEGVATITASFAGNDYYNSGVASYTVTVADLTVGGSYVAVTSDEDLVAGDKYIIVYGGNTAMSTTQNTNNRGKTSVTLTEGVITLTDESSVAAVKLGGVSGAWTLQTLAGYLQSPSASNYLTCSETVSSNNQKWTITPAETKTSIRNNGHTSYYIQYNKSSSIFSCYTNTQYDVQLYHKIVLEDAELSFASSTAIATYGSDFSEPVLDNPNSASLTWTSSDETVATVNSSGEVTLLKSGETTITATARGYYTGDASYTLTVNRAATSLAFAASTPSIYVGDDTYTQTATITPVGADNIISYAFVGEYGAATINSSTGTVTFNNYEGELTVEATATQTDRYAAPTAQSYTLTVVGNKIASIALSSTSGSTTFGTNMTIDATFADEDYLDVEGAGVTATGYNSSIATYSFNASTKKITITPVAVGTTTFTFQANEVTGYDEGSTVNFTITVNAPVGLAKAALDFDFTTNGWGLPTTYDHSETERSYTHSTNGHTIKLYGPTSNGFKFSDDYLIMGKSGAYLTLPVFDKAVTQIDVEGTSGASESVVQNIYVGEIAVSTATTGAKNVTNKYEIHSDYQAAGNIYKLKVTSSHNTQITRIVVHFAVPTITATLNASGYATFCSEYPLDFSEAEANGYSAWQITAANSSTGVITFSKITGSVKGGTGVLLKGTAGETIELTSVNSTNTLDDNLLYGTLAPTYVATGQYYGLSGYQFKKVNAGNVLAGKALLPASALSSNVKAFTFVFEEDDATGIESIQNSKFKIQNEGAIYNLAGQRINKMQKGINIVNGKKVMK